jgi:hypothetical protein
MFLNKSDNLLNGIVIFKVVRQATTKITPISHIVEVVSGSDSENLKVGLD